MEKTSLKLIFLFSLAVIALCSYTVDAREMTEEEVTCLGGKCPEGKKNCNCLPQVTPVEKFTPLCYKNDDCIKYCPPNCKPDSPCSCECNGGLCACQC